MTFGTQAWLALVVACASSSAAGAAPCHLSKDETHCVTAKAKSKTHHTARAPASGVHEIGSNKPAAPSHNGARTVTPAMMAPTAPQPE